MKAMLLAAGRGTRMLPLTKDKPKCLLEVAGQTLIEYHLFALAKAGIREVVINAAYWATLIQQALGDGSRYGLRIEYSIEAQPLETGGGIMKALPLLGDTPFLVVNTDIWTDYPYQQLLNQPEKMIHLVMVDNPDYDPEGDFYLQQNILNMTTGKCLTYSGIGVFRPQLFANYKVEIFSLREPLLAALNQNVATGEHYQGQWYDIGTPKRLAKLQTKLTKNSKIE